MQYCIHCGGELVDGARFCSSCGAPVGGGSSKSENSTVKCPQCGERIDAFVAKCPACGHELRGSQTLSRVRELEDDLEGVESLKSVRSLSATSISRIRRRISTSSSFLQLQISRPGEAMMLLGGRSLSRQCRKQS